MRITARGRVMLLIMLIGTGLAGVPVVSGAAESLAAAPAAPTFAEAHQYFGALVSDSDVQALYETRS